MFGEHPKSQLIFRLTKSDRVLLLIRACNISQLGNYTPEIIQEYFDFIKKFRPSFLKSSEKCFLESGKINFSDQFSSSTNSLRERCLKKFLRYPLPLILLELPNSFCQSFPLYICLSTVSSTSAKRRHYTKIVGGSI